MQVHQSTKSISAKTIQRKWTIVDAGNQVLGRIASEIATTLMGKRKVNQVPYLDMGDYVVVINAATVKVTGKKEDNKIYDNIVKINEILSKSLK